MNSTLDLEKGVRTGVTATIKHINPSAWRALSTFEAIILFMINTENNLWGIFLRSRVSRPMAMTGHVDATWGGSFWRV